MNQKKAKAIRRYVRSLGAIKRKLNQPRTGVMVYTDPVSRAQFRYDLPMTATYPAASFQRTYCVAKRAMRSLPMFVLKARANLNFAAGGEPA